MTASPPPPGAGPAIQKALDQLRDGYLRQFQGQTTADITAQVKAASPAAADTRFLRAALQALAGRDDLTVREAEVVRAVIEGLEGAQ